MFPEIFKHAQTIAHQEEVMNEDVLFAEIAHLCHLHTANINRRPHLYDYEIPVLTNSTLPEKNQIQLDDLLVSVVNNKVILKSKRLKKRIIPRLSSAFNYSKNSFPVFRFLCDLQNQDLKTAFHFSLSSIIPGLQFYPRICYKSCIIQLAEWHLNANDLKLLRSKDNWLDAFGQLARKINLPRFFSYATADLFLVFDSMKEDDIHLLMNETCDKNKIVLKEFPFLQNGTITTETNEVLIPQYVAALYKTETTYQHSSISTLTIKQNEKKSTADWIYFKIYCHPLSSNTILTEHLLPFINKLKRHKLIKKWFWIRYNDPDYHIRIRVQTSAASEKETFNLFTACLNKLQVNHLITRFYPSAYLRELDRYSAALIEYVEDVFQASSECIALLLKEDGCKNFQSEKVIIEAVLAMHIIFDLFELSSSEKISLSKTGLTNFFNEFNGSWELKAEIEKLYKQVSPQLETDFSNVPYNKYEVIKKKITALIVEYKSRKINSVSLQKLCGDIIHMHLNRLFIHEQRYFEMVCYYLLNRTLNAEKYRLLSNTSPIQ